MRVSMLLAAALWLGVGSVAQADAGSPPDLDTIRAQQAELRALAQAGEGIFEGYSEPRRQELVARQGQLLAMLEGVDDFHALDKDDQFEVFNELEWINAAVNDARSAQVVCEYTRKTGSNRKVKVCQTMAEREADREASQDALRDMREAYGPLPGG